MIYIFLLLLCQSATSGDTTQKDEEKLRHLKEVLWPKSYREQDTVLLDQILADEFQMIDADGIWSTKSTEIAYIKANKPTYDSFRYEIRRLEIFENNTAVISGVGTIAGTNENGAYTLIYHSSNILIKRGDQWKAINSHVSGVRNSQP